MLHVELLPDDPFETRLRADWEALERLDLPNLSRHRSTSNRPHVTLSVHSDDVLADDPAGGRPRGPAREALADRLQQGLPLPLRLGALSVFGSGPYVLVRTLVVSTGLLALHAGVQELLGPPCVAHCEVGRWVPHTTVAHRLDADQVARALSVLDPSPPPGTLVRARLWDSTRRVLEDLA
ncbi:2'-5' RNA ligase family protein [Auraticoccus monumenti]|uniref:2'-5' RNA ligase superfamily protein n=1 Tax=Auraticoccus monumenti TaxID=675864 RepID=A0A1G6SID5_9ACTN|nr:2'-5' RNA ligase family protein [Auraticoccus monumenti]SDD15885.1 2'-5' RNA ligase superfamily protein [Auraticoccus monumenti]